MITEIILIVLTLVIFTGIVYWIVARPMRQLQKTVDELQNVSNATTNLLERSQQDIVTLRHRCPYREKTDLNDQT